MPSTINPAAVLAPPFPDDVPIAPLMKVSLRKLLDKDKKETDRLFEACKTLGFFYLDLQETAQGDSILEDANDLFDLSEHFFELDLEEKKKYDMSGQRSYFRYKGYGAAVISKDGMLDRNEFYNVSKDDILSVSAPLPAPTLITLARPLLKSYITTAHSIVTLLLTHLESHLHIPAETLTSLHRIDAAAGDQIRFVKAPPQPEDDRRTAMGEHSDFGSITILFNRLGGLQVLLPGSTTDWVYVRPLPGHAIANLGDAMVKFTNGLLRSNIHRVVSPPGAQAEHTRYSLVYFSRPEDEVVLKALKVGDVIPRSQEEEEEISSKDWILRRALGKRIGVFNDEEWEKAQGTEKVSQRVPIVQV